MLILLPVQVVLVYTVYLVRYLLTYLVKINFCKNLWVSLKFLLVQHTAVIAVVYHHPRIDANAFTETLNNKLGEIDCNKNNFYVIGDINLNVSESNVLYLPLITSLC